LIRALPFDPRCVTLDALDQDPAVPGMVEHDDLTVSGKRSQKRCR
jgi:hypothetical protein